jgi:hypothetical protein
MRNKLPTELESNANSILKLLHDLSEKRGVDDFISAEYIQKTTGLSPLQINHAVELLKSNGFVQWLQTLGTAPYNFAFVQLTARGEYEFQRRQFVLKSEVAIKEETKRGETLPIREMIAALLERKPPSPIGSPYGFTDKDWESVSAWKANKNVLYVVFGCKFNSEYCDYTALGKNIENMFRQALNRYNQENAGANVELKFEPLHAGYGEHLFNEIARDIISSDIAVFETSDLAPNVFIEIGVALTWGSRVFLIKSENRPVPATDISGQTYADYRDNGNIFVDAQHSEKLYRMVERAVRKKG